VTRKRRRSSGMWERTPQVREKSASSGGYFLDGGWLPAGSAMNWWQMGQSLQPYSSASARVEACVGAYSQTVAMCPGYHVRQMEGGGTERVLNSALARILRSPNDYQTISDFMLNLTRNLYCDGNAYALAIRNDRFEISELHLMNSRSCYARIGEDGTIFYGLGGNTIAEARFGGLAAVPARDVLHVRLQTPRDPLRGESPVMAAALALAASNAALQQQVAFFTNQARPSFILSTDKDMKPENVRQVRAGWDEQTRGMNAGGTPILHGGLKPHLISSTAQDAQLAETMKLGDQAVAEVYRIPPQVLGIGDTPYASTEALMAQWKSTGLGFALNHIEEALGSLFRLKGGELEYVEFSTDALMRSSFKERLETLNKATQRVFKINEARAMEGLPPVEGGDIIRVQQQDVPLNAWEMSQTAASAPPSSPSPPASKSDDPHEDAGHDSVDAIIERIYASAQLH
jgi:HK97 family phage portal protein